jgi:hypothetical protein
MQSMTRLICITGVYLSIIFTVALLLIHAQPYDDTELRAFLFPANDCAAPCFMGIQPGVTTIDDALAVLETNAWVGEVYKINYPSYLSWSWSGLQPTFIDSSKNGEIAAYSGRGVEKIIIPTKFSVIEFWWLYGKPYWQDFGFMENGTAIYDFAFPEKNIIVSSIRMSCQKALYTLINKSTLSIQADIPETHKPTYDFDPYNVTLKAFTSKILCREA